ncbi:MAG: T9SS type A sorting domain-containing protein [Flavobacteriales bacterium]|nr:T9SS type A sorting domain-containing protein [Flavobacteriales bacterium]MCB9194311.1 T9SS type A sorting domain-containing protein [Flavobacteriales bacterium]
MVRTLLLPLLTASVLSAPAQVRIVKIDIAQDQVVLGNYGNTTVDVSSYWFIWLSNAAQVSSLTVVLGNPVLGPALNVTFSGFGLSTISDLALYTSNVDHNDTALMADFTEWGAAGQGYESVAVAKGIWTAGTFIGGLPPYIWVGDCCQFGAQYWVPSNSGIDAPDALATAQVHPNPVHDALHIDLGPVSSPVHGVLAAADGRTLRTFHLGAGSTTTLNVQDLAVGTYLLTLHTPEAHVHRRVVVQR